jgi:hypothetical protein
MIVGAASPGQLDSTRESVARQIVRLQAVLAPSGEQQ